MSTRCKSMGVGIGGVREDETMRKLTVGGLRPLLLLGVLWACEESENLPPSLTPLEEQQLIVNQPWSLEVFAADPEGEVLRFQFSIDPPIQTPTEGDTARPRLQPLSREKALLQWTPGYGDVGRYTITVSVTDPEGLSAEESLQLQVLGGQSAALSPRFIAPRGAGLIHDLSRAPCIEPMLIEVQADAIPDEELLIDLGPAPPEGAELDPPATLPGKRRRLNWCPSPALLEESDRVPMLIRARRRGEPGGVEKRFLFTFLQERGADCPGRAPILTHQPPDQLSGIADYSLELEVRDDLGIKSPPLLAYLINPSVDPRQLSPDMQLPWEIVESSAVGESRWRASVPNPGLPPESVGQLFYYFIAVDNDDPEGARCDHMSESPIYEVPLQGSAERGGLGSCAPCSNHLQCGGESDLCVTLDDGERCGLACGPDGGCPQGLSCFSISVEGERFPDQCLPDTLSCTESCQGDRFDGEPSPPTLPLGVHEGLQLCSGDEADFYWVQSSAGQGLSVRLRFQDMLGDLDLYLSTRDDAEGAPLFDYQSAEGGSDEERVEVPCYDQESDLLIAVVPFEGASNRYALSLESRACESCIDDPLEMLESTEGAIPEGEAGGALTLCPGDQDRVTLTLSPEQLLSVYLSGAPESRGLSMRLESAAGQNVAEALSLGEVDALLEYRAPAVGDYLLIIEGLDPGSSGVYLLDIERLLVPPCDSTVDCPAESYCVSQLGCFDQRCGADLGCAPEHRCLGPFNPRGAIDAEMGRCVSSCAEGEPCRVGERCKRLADGDRRCISEGALPAAAPCLTHSDCAGEAACVQEEEGGRCRIGGCTALEPCIGGERCVSLSTGSACLNE
ncbi:MAG: Ig domain-containing protein [Myxococcota bacterium]|nr:Ig domain-containing protein [Myxococcota bacterium]